MSWYKHIIAISIVALFIYITVFINQNPTHILYSDNILDKNNVGEPVVNCNYDAREINPLVGSKSSAYIRVNGEKCRVTNIPYGHNNIYLKHSNIFIYYIYMMQGWFFVFAIIFAYFLHRKKIRAFLSNARNS
jgi:hypothetical protein